MRESVLGHAETTRLCSIYFMGDISEDFWISRKKHLEKKET